MSQNRGLELLEFITDTEQILEQMYAHIITGVRVNYPNLNHTQALLLARIPDEGSSISVLIPRGYTIGNNTSYNITKLVKRGYIRMETSPVDRRRKKIILTHHGFMVKQLIIRILSELENFPKKVTSATDEQ